MYGKDPYAFTGPQAQAPTPAGYPGMPPTLSGQTFAPQMMGQPPMVYGGMIPVTAPGPEETYVENILRMNRGKVATIYTTNENNPQWGAKVFKGRVENAARDHVVLSDPETGMRYIVLMINVDYLTFDEPLRYEPGIYQPR